MTLYHSTTPAAAKAICVDGFKDNTRNYLTSGKRTGVWLSNYPLDENEGCKGNAVLMVSGLEESEIAPYEWIEKGKPYREWLVPARILNGRVTVKLLEPES